MFAPELKTSGHARASFGQLKKQSHASVMVKCVFAGGAHCPASHLKADLPGPSKQGLWRQVCIRVGTPQMCGAACGLDGDLIRRRGLQPRGRVRWWTETPGVHWGVVKVLPAACLPVAFHRPVLDKTVTVRNSETVTSTLIIKPQETRTDKCSGFPSTEERLWSRVM